MTYILGEKRKSKHLPWKKLNGSPYGFSTFGYRKEIHTLAIRKILSESESHYTPISLKLKEEHYTVILSCEGATTSNSKFTNKVLLKAIMNPLL